MGFDDSAINYYTSSDHKTGKDLEFCRQYFKNTHFDKLLDIAAATGHFAKIFEASFKVATDISLNMLKIAREKNGLEHLVSCKAEELPFKKACFDIVICRIALHHFKKPEAFFEEVHRVLENKGVFVLIDSIVDTDEKYLNKIEFIRDNTHIKSLTVTEIMQLADKKFRLLGFQNIFKKHDFSEWAKRLNPDNRTLKNIKNEFLQLPETIKKELKVEIKNKEIISYTDKKGIFIFQKI